MFLESVVKCRLVNPGGPSKLDVSPGVWWVESSSDCEASFRKEDLDWGADLGFQVDSGCEGQMQ